MSSPYAPLSRTLTVTDQILVASPGGPQYVTLEQVNTFIGNTSTTWLNTHDFGGADSFELPNSATPTVDADGEIALDTSVADFSHGVVKYFGGEEMGVVAMPIAQFTTPTDGYVVAYNATTDEFELVAQAGGGGGTGDVTFAGDTFYGTTGITMYGGAGAASGTSLFLGATASQWYSADLTSYIDVSDSGSLSIYGDSLSMQGFGGTLDMGMGYFYDSYTSVDFSSRILVEGMAGGTTVDWGGGYMYDNAAGISLEWYSNRYLVDNMGVTAVNWDTRIAYDSSSTTSVDWGNRYLRDGMGVQVMDWGMGYINDFSGNNSIDWASRYLNDTGSSVAVDYANRDLYDSMGSISFSWDTTPSTVSIVATGTDVAYETAINDIISALQNYGILTI